MTADSPENPPVPENSPAPPAEGEELLSLENASDEVLRLQLEKFEGPFEVLLYLIRSQEIDIFDIPIVKVTEQYLRFVELIRDQNLDMAGEFIVMAATLIQIKARMLMPVEVEEEEEEVEEEDPRLELVEKLLEYRKFRDLSVALATREEMRENLFPRRVKPVIEPDEDEEEILEVSLYDLIKAVRSILKYVTDPYIHQVHGEGASVDEKIAEIVDLLERQESVAWSDLFQRAKNKVELVCCLLAILELCRMRRIRAHQHHNFGEIRLFARAPEDAEQEIDVVASA